MKSKLLLIYAVSSSCFAFDSTEFLQKKGELLNKAQHAISQFVSIAGRQLTSNEINYMLHHEATTLNPAVINKVLTTLQCAKEYNVDHNNTLTIIDYSLPSSEKRLWVFNLKEKKLLFHTYVSHGIKSGAALSNRFSNKNNSKASSIGVYQTEKTYYGRDGLSLRLDGLEKGFNDNASNRYVVMHGGWYVDEDFIKKYGRAGRSWGCPALPLNLTAPIIHTIKDKSLFVIYYPSDNWFLKSKFLNCGNLAAAQKASKISIETPTQDNELRENVLFANVSIKNKESEPIVVMAADNYQRIFQTKAPLERMLRRQINHMEYIALSNDELNSIVSSTSKENLALVNFVVPVLKMRGGYYATEMQIVDLGKITRVHLHPTLSSKDLSYTVDFEAKPSVNLRATNQFIRWLGL